VRTSVKPGTKKPTRNEPLAFAFGGLVLFMIVYFARPEDWIPALALLPVAKISACLILLPIAFSFSSIRWRLPIEVTFLTLLVVQLWIAAVLSPVWKGGAVNTMLDFSKVLPLVVIMFAVVRSVSRFRWIFFVQATCVSVVAVLSVLYRHPIGDRMRGFLAGVYRNPNDLALIIALTIPFCLAFAFKTSRYWEKLLWAAAMLTMIYSVALTASRGGALALGVASLVCLWQLGVRGRRFYLILLVPVAVVGFWIVAGTNLQNRFTQTSTDITVVNRSTEASASSQQRTQLLLQSIEVTARYPIFGIGPGNFPTMSGVWLVTHNSYTQMSAEGGLPALILYLLVFWRVSVNLREVSKFSGVKKEVHLFSMALKASLAAYLVGSFFASVAYQIFPYFLVAYSSSLREIVAQSSRTLVKRAEANVPQEAPQLEMMVWE
jgi:hypothetical protein